jgi:hypothetical protein
MEQAGVPACSVRRETADDSGESASVRPRFVCDIRSPAVPDSSEGSGTGPAGGFPPSKERQYLADDEPGYGTHDEQEREYAYEITNQLGEIHTRGHFRILNNRLGRDDRGTGDVERPLTRTRPRRTGGVL